ncbi:hypothetical protein D3C87_1170800 [compost metagenome]
MDLARVGQIAGGQRQRCTGGQCARVVQQAVRGDIGVGIRRDIAAKIAQGAGGDVQILSGADAASLIVHGSRGDQHLLAHQALRARRHRLIEGVAVAHAGGGDGQRFIGLDQAGVVVQHSQGRERDAAPCDDAS